MGGPRHFDGLCSHCRAEPRLPYNNSYCRECRNIFARANRPAWTALTPEQRRRANARSIALVYQKRGLLAKGPCERCGDPDAQNHHDNYDRPLEVRRFCRACHARHHVVNGHPPPTTEDDLRALRKAQADEDRRWREQRREERRREFASRRK